MTGSKKALHYWSVTLSFNFTEFKQHSEIECIMEEFSEDWAFQLEKGHNEGKLHYQCRMILNTPQYTATMVSIFGERGFDPRDVTFLPETNKSIQQGGLAFYVMKLDTRVEGPWYDSSFTLPRPKDWIPRQCRDVVDNPRPWITSVLAMIEAPPSHRTITWIMTLDGKGGVQKSLFNTYLEASGKARYLGSGTTNQLLEGCIMDGEARCYTLDFPKHFASDNQIGDYITAIEHVKNGFIKTAFHGKRKLMIMEDRPHVIVFSNRSPPYAYMTEGRFDCYSINPDESPEFQTLNKWYPNSTISEQISQGVPGT